MGNLKFVNRDLITLRELPTVIKYIKKHNYTDVEYDHLNPPISAFLIPECEAQDGWEIWLKKNYYMLLVEMFFNYGESYAPSEEEATWEMFDSFYHVQHYELLYDCLDTPLVRDAQDIDDLIMDVNPN